MNINVLIEQLQDLAEAHPDAEVRLATQPTWPLANDILGITDGFELREVPEGPCPDHDVEGCEECLDEQEPAYIWLCSGDSHGYASKDVFEMAVS